MSPSRSDVGEVQHRRDARPGSRVVELHLGAESRLVAKFAGGDAWLEECLFGERPMVSVPQGVSLAPPRNSAVPTNSGAAAPWATLEIPVNHPGGGDASMAERFVLHVVGGLSDYPLPAQPTTDGDQGQLAFIALTRRLFTLMSFVAAKETGADLRGTQPRGASAKEAAVEQAVAAFRVRDQSGRNAP